MVEIEASARDGVLGIHVRNSIVGNGPRGTGLGLRNVESRLKHLYFGKANLHLNMADETCDREFGIAGVGMSSRRL